MFDIFDPVTLHTLLNMVIIGVIAGGFFIVAFHIAMDNDGFSYKDILYFAAGPLVGFVGTVLGFTQAEVIFYTFTVNLGAAGIKEGGLKLGGVVANRTVPRLNNASSDELAAALRTKLEEEKLDG